MKKTALTIRNILLSLVLITSLIACKAEKKTIYGTWLGDGIELTLREDGTFACNFDPKEGTFKIEGDTLTLYQELHSDMESQASCKYEFDEKKDTLTLFLNDEGTTFTRKQVK